MRVAHVLPSVARAFGGPPVALMGFAAAARARGIEVTVFAPRPRADADVRWITDGLPGVRLALAPSRLGALHALRAALRSPATPSDRIDVVEIHGAMNPYTPAALGIVRRAGVAAIVHPFGTLSHYTLSYRRAWAKGAYSRLFERPMLAGAPFHFTTVEERDDALSLPLVRPGATFVVPPPFTPEWTDDIAAHRPLTGAGRRVLFLSRLHPKKNIEALLEAWPTVADAIPESTLTIAGNGEPGYERSIRNAAARHGARVRMPGMLVDEEKVSVFRDADVFVLPSFHENFGVVILEAASAGIPVVLTPQVQLASWVEANGLGVVVSTAPSSVADGVTRALRDDKLRRHCRDHGPSLVAGTFGPDVVGVALERMYRAVLGRAG
jgi:glycosyltransferase involved in cell wall biosynthesis